MTSMIERLISQAVSNEVDMTALADAAQVQAQKDDRTFHLVYGFDVPEES
ncbi:hypothetical protein DOU02_06670 [Clavibacter michiganensis subsp. michiganensis]|nr:hypothetical protein [Clavibacter michiganensis]KAF0258761.1 hypothetical protein DOU02_06670 [Clavibacter michiganensis subsp. michiganensis]